MAWPVASLEFVSLISDHWLTGVGVRRDTAGHWRRHPRQPTAWPGRWVADRRADGPGVERHRSWVSGRTIG